jgi:hypothetical protein
MAGIANGPRSGHVIGVGENDLRSMIREEILDDGTRRYVLSSGPGIPEEEVSEERYLGWVVFRARSLEAIADPDLRARCAAQQATLGRLSTPQRPTTGQRNVAWSSHPRRRHARGHGRMARLVRAASRSASRRLNQA